MPDIVLPITLPQAPQPGYAAVFRETAARSTLSGYPQARRRFSDLITDVSAVAWTYTPAQMAIWYPWFHETLRDGQLWFEAKMPGPGGLVNRVMRFRPGSVQVTPLGGGVCQVTAQLEIRGRSVTPAV